jgi:hypothetical protein
VRSVSPKQALAFVREHGAVLEAARGPLPSLAVTIAGGPIRGSWWGHPTGHEIFQAAEAVTESGEVLTCRLADGKATYVHRRLWPALVKLAPRFRRDQLARVWSEHTASGAHRKRREAFPRWVPREVLEQAARLTEEDAERLLAPCLPFARARGRATLRTRRPHADAGRAPSSPRRRP